MATLYARERIYTEDPTAATNRVWLDRLNTAGPSIISGLRYSTSYPGGDVSASCSLTALPDLSHLGLRAGRKFIIQSGAANRWQGFLDEALRPSTPGAPWQLTATGLAGLVARDQWDTDGNGYSLNAGVDAAISRGLQWTRPAALSSVTASTPQSQLSLNQALSAVGKAAGTVWALSASGAITMAAPPTAPTYALRATQPLAPKLTGWTQAVGVYQLTSSTVGWVTTSNAAAIAKFGNREGTYDMTNLGVITSGTASGYLATWLATNLAAPTYTDAILVQNGQLRTVTPAGGGHPQAMGGPVDLGTVRAGCLVQILDSDPSHANLLAPGQMNMLVGGTEYDVDNDLLTLTPVGYQGQDFLSVIYQGLGGAL
jgi:hypothetical protein